MLPITELRKKLVARRRELFADAAHTEEDLLSLELDPQSETTEQGQEETMIRLLDRMDARFKVEIEAIDRALVRIETGGYGVCGSCGRKIDQARLEALPWADVCLTCAQQEQPRTNPRS